MWGGWLLLAKNNGFITAFLVTTFGCVILLSTLNITEYSYSTNVPQDIYINKTGKTFKVLWYSYPPFLVNQGANYCGFESCKFNNCEISFERRDATKSDAVIFDGRFMPKQLKFQRPMGQVWIFAAHEGPNTYGISGNWWFKNKHYVFNWTMTYNKENTDIYLPYGEIVKRPEITSRNFRAIAEKKNKTALIIASHCTTDAKRQEFVEKLRKHVDVDILGDCGKKWNCGRRYKHDDCFELLNTNYMFYLAFENAFCHQYFTEKFFDNFNYDIIMVTRGGSKGEAKNMFPLDTFISTDDFNSIKELGHFLKTISTDEYVKLLARKSQFYSVGYKAVYQRALCEICERLNNAEAYRKVVKDMYKWAFGKKPCSSSVEDID